MTISSLPHVHLTLKNELSELWWLNVNERLEVWVMHSKPCLYSSQQGRWSLMVIFSDSLTSPRI